MQTSINADPTADNTCETTYWVCQDANYNVLGVVDSTGSLKERYEYTPYGQRTVLLSAGSNDPDPMSPTPLLSRRVPFTGGVNHPYGLCEFGHQGLYHDEELSLSDGHKARGRSESRQTHVGRPEPMAMK